MPIQPAGSPQERFRVSAMRIGRQWGVLKQLAHHGVVSAGLRRATTSTRPGLIEEYSTNTDGIRQDFLVTERPGGAGRLVVEFGVEGARSPTANFWSPLRTAYYWRRSLTSVPLEEFRSSAKITRPPSRSKSTRRSAMRTGSAWESSLESTGISTLWQSTLRAKTYTSVATSQSPVAKFLPMLPACA
ncbi:MAG: hypothetical protein ACI8XO_001882 [Verrucomicrobiales bacterium]|jgi:hypothetical protein